jgi:hypothetical protein
MAVRSGATSSQSFAQGAPVLFRLAFHGRRGGVLDLEPVVHAAMAVCRTEAFRDDTFAPKGAGVPEDDFPVAVEMLVEGDAIIRAAEEIGQRVLTILKARPSDILAVEFDEIEGAQYSGVVVKPMAESFEYREAGFVDHDCLAVDDTGTDR